MASNFLLAIWIVGLRSASRTSKNLRYEHPNGPFLSFLTWICTILVHYIIIYNVNEYCIRVFFDLKPRSSPFEVKEKLYCMRSLLFATILQ